MNGSEKKINNAIHTQYICYLFIIFETLNKGLNERERKKKHKAAKQKQ